MTARVPFAERGGPVRGLLDLASGCYPAFLFGGSIGDALPVFHFHETTRAWLEPRLGHLVDNGYRTVTCDEIARFVMDGVRPAPRSVALTFDDAWASAYAVALPLLRACGLRAIVFAIPARIAEDGAASPFVSWAQLREMHASGVFDVQSHTRSHAMMFGGDVVVDYVTPAFAGEPLLNRPVTTINGHVDTVGADALGTPLYVRRSRMSDARRWVPDGAIADRCRDHVVARGGARFFERPGWRRELTALVPAGRGAFEPESDRRAVIERELAEGRALLNAGLRTDTVRHVALPWGIAGETTRAALASTGHVTAFAERPWRRRIVRAGDDRFQLMRLNGNFLTCLPGRGRRWFFSTVR